MGMGVGSAAADTPEGPHPMKKKVSIEFRYRNVQG